MNDEYEIQKLLYLCVERLDRADREGMAELFRDAEVLLGPHWEPVRGAEPMARFFDDLIQLHSDGTPRTHHVVTNPIIEFDAGRQKATCRSYYTALQQTEALPLQVIAAGRYLDSFAKIDGRWRFTRREYDMRFTGDVSQHVKRPI